MPRVKSSPRSPKSGRAKVRRVAARTTTTGANLAVDGPLAELVDGLICECRGSDIVVINAVGRKLLGYKRGSPVGEPLANFIGGGAGKRLVRTLSPLSKGRQPKRLTLIARNGDAVAVAARAVEVRRGRATHILIAARPVDVVTDPLGNDRARTVLDSLPLGVLVIDRMGIVRGANKSAMAMLRLTPRRLAGLVAAQVLPEWDSKLKGLLGVSSIATVVRQDGSRFPTEITVAATEDDELLSVTLRDVGGAASGGSRRNRAERLECEVDLRTAEIDTLSRQNERILEAASEGIVAVALEGSIQSVNRAAADMLNRDPMALAGMSLDQAFIFGAGTAVGVAGHPATLRAHLWTGPYHIPLEARLARSDGESFDAEYTIPPIIERRETRGHVVAFRDITDRKRAEAEILLGATVFEHSPEGLLVADAKGRVTKTNSSFQRITGYGEAEVIGRSLADVLFAESKVSATALDPLKTKRTAEWEHWSKNKQGRRYAARVAVSVVRDRKDRIQQYAAILTDITQRKLDEEKILYQANYDQLTGLANRTLFLDRLSRLVMESKRARTNVGLMFIDLDGFKAINDTLGHDAGDLLLQGTARRLEKCVRETDTVARLGGDEFTVIMPLIAGLDAAAMVADRIIRSLTEEFDLDGKPGRVSASIGISVLPDQTSDASGLLHNADLAMYHAKRQGRANYQFYTPDLDVPEDRPPRG